jgi:hypothetical protein
VIATRYMIFRQLATVLIFTFASFCLIAPGAIAVPTTATPTAPTAVAQAAAAPKGGPYPEAVTRNLLETCRSNESGIPLVLPLDRSRTTTAKALVQDPINQINQRAKDAIAQGESQVQERQQELAELFKNKEQFSAQVEQLKAAIAGKQIPAEQLPKVQKLLKDMQDIQGNPALLAQKANDSRKELKETIGKQQATEVKKLTDCACVVDTFEARYPVETFYQQSIAELTSGTATVSKDWAAAKATCGKGK